MISGMARWVLIPPYMGDLLSVRFKDLCHGAEFLFHPTGSKVF